MIWGFAFKFFFKLWLVGRKFTYGKQVGTPTRFPTKLSWADMRETMPVPSFAAWP